MDPPSAEVQAQLVEALDDLGIAVLVAKGQRFVYANRSAARLAGTTPEALVGGGSFFDMVAPQERARLQERLRDRLAGRLADVEDLEVTLRDGRRLALAMAVKLLPGEPGSFVVLYRDVTGRKQEEARLRQSEKLATAGKLLAGVAHDINTPLAVVLSNMEVCREQVERALAERRPLTRDETATLVTCMEADRAHLRRIATSIRRLQGLASPQAPRRVATDLRPALLATVETARFAAGSSVEIEVDLPELASVVCDGDLVVYAVQNVLSNAVEAARSRVRLHVRTEAGAFEAVVEDDGPGFAPEVLDRVFEPFYTTKSAGNMGIGLTLARSIANDHGGAVTLGNVPGGGARVVLRIPLEVRR